MTRLVKLLGARGLRFVQAVVRSLPPQGIGALAWLTGTLWYALDPRRRVRVAENLRVAYGDAYEGAAGRRMTRALFRNMIRVPIEVIWSGRLLGTASQIERRCTFHGPWPPPGERGGVFFSGHLGNWEVTARAVRSRLGRLRMVARRIASPEIDEIATRSRGGPEDVIPKHGAYRDLVRSVRDGHWVLIVGDQNAGLRGIFVPFFGLEASTWETPARLALREGVPLDLVAAIRRPGRDLHFDVHRERLDDGSEASRDREAVRALTARAQARLEALIRETPEQYNFLHRRWKDRPADEAPGRRLPRYDHRGAPG